jgi:hypothetical protein
MFNVLLLTSGQRDAVTTALGELEKIKARLPEEQVDLVQFRQAEWTSPDHLAEMLKKDTFDVIHLNLSGAPANGLGQGQGSAGPAREGERDLLEGTGDQPVVILDACSAQQAARLVPGSYPCLIELPAGIDRDSVPSFLAGLYETLTRGHTLQTAFWLGCCKTKTGQEPVPTLRCAPGFDPRKKSYNPPRRKSSSLQPAPKLPLPSAEKFFDDYSELCNEIKEEIAQPLIRRYGELIAMVYEGAGPVPVDQQKEFSNDFADLCIAIYRGSLALELQRRKFGEYEDPSRRYASLYEWTLYTEVREAELENWLKDHARDKYDAHDAQHREMLGPDWQKQIISVEGRDGLARNFCERDMGFAHVAGLEFSRLMRGLYLRSAGEADRDLLPESANSHGKS